jgi:hypothetical protein
MTDRPHHERLRAREPRHSFAVLLSAWPPERERRRRAGIASATQRHDAIIGISRAVFALGGALVVPADPDTALVIAAVAFDYAPLPTAERRDALPAPLTVMETERDEKHLRALMTPYIALGAVQYFDRERRPIGPQPEWATLDLRSIEHVRHSVTGDLLGMFPLSGAIFISAAPDAEREMDLLKERRVPIAVLSSTVDDPALADRWSAYDPSREMLRADRSDRWSEREPRRERRRRPVERVPYAFVVQRLILQWSRGRQD